MVKMTVVWLHTVNEVVPSSVELRWRPVVRQAAATSSSCTTGVTVRVISASSAARKCARCRWPFTRRNCLPASTMPAAHQRSAICPSRQRLTLTECARDYSACGRDPDVSAGEFGEDVEGSAAVLGRGGQIGAHRGEVLG